MVRKVAVCNFLHLLLIYRLKFRKKCCIIILDVINNNTEEVNSAVWNWSVLL